MKAQYPMEYAVGIEVDDLCASCDNEQFMSKFNEYLPKYPKHTDGLLDASTGHLTIPFPNAIKAIMDNQPITVWIKDSITKKLLKQIKVNKVA
jgi:hypothetical protein